MMIKTSDGLKAIPAWMVFLLGALPAIAFALFTQHAWEDWYITYRAGKNLANGYGLVFEHGQVLHTFTSPLNVLVPAFFSWLTGNDDMVLWLYRVLGAVLLGASAVCVLRVVRAQGYALWVAVCALLWLAIDGKIIDFTINGQEAGFMVFFLALTLLALVEQRTLLLGVAWAGLMWSRPDSFVYIGALGLGYGWMRLLQQQDTWQGLVLRYVKAALVAALLYAPWLLWTTWYYGTPVPHTVVAKGLDGHLSVTGLLQSLLLFPWTSLVQVTALNYAFMPSYFVMGGWPDALALLARGLAWFAAMAWLLPRVSPFVRMLSLVTFLTGFYLEHVAPFYPWYYPPLGFFSILTLSALLQQCWQALPSWQRGLRWVSASIVAIWLLVTVAMAWQVRVQQTVIEEGLRKPLGLWLREQAGNERQTVFVECLGYIGFYSGLKMYDYPGMSSPEMVAARRVVGEDWVQLIRYLQPDWLVFRLREAQLVYQVDPALLEQVYQEAAVFDRSRELQRYAFLPGRGYLEYDQAFVVFRKVVDTGEQPSLGGSGNGVTEETPEVVGEPAP